jgi:hypothetical protein
MPNVYREKSCQHCGVLHRKRGPYCSQACSNKDREVSDTVRNNMRRVSEDYHRTPEAIAAKKLINSPLTTEDYAVAIPTFYDIPDGYTPNEF